MPHSERSGIVIRQMYDENCMTAEERRIANAALRAGPYDNHDELVIAVGAGLKLHPQTVEAVLQKLRIRQVLNCIGTPDHQKPSVRYERGVDWTEEG